MNVTLFYEHVTVLDYAYVDSLKGAIGNSLIVDVEFLGATDEDGVVYDFSYAKKKVKEIIDRDCDHRLIVPRNILKEQAGLTQLKYEFGAHKELLFYEAPAQAFCQLSSDEISYESIANFLETQIMLEMPSTIASVKIHLREELLSPQSAVFHYTHGLKNHYGNCQRLFHGHRNTLEIWINGQRSAKAEKEMADELFSANIHFCSWENVVNRGEIVKATSQELPEGRILAPNLKVHIMYQSSQGKFYGEVPAHMVYLMHTETTVENLASHFAKVVKTRLKSSDLIRVRAFEGIGKGAFVSF